MFQLYRYHGFARVMVYLAGCIAFWPELLFEAWDRGYSWRHIWLRIQQEIALMNGVSMETVRQWRVEG